MKKVLAGVAALTLLVPATASAHGIVGRQDLPVPRWLFVWAASAVLVASFAGLAALWQQPQFETPRERVIASVPRVFEVLAGVIGVAWFGLVVYAGFAGSQTTVDNIAPTAVYVVFWVGFPVASFIFGDVFRVFSPWRAIGRAAGWIAKRVGGESMAEPLTYPARLGHWPAAATILCFTWLELVYANNDDPSIIAALALAYMVIQLVGMTVYGVEQWITKADGFGVLFGLYARISPLDLRAGKIRWRRPLEGLASFKPVAGSVALLCVAIGTTSFDGGSQGELWSEIAPHLQDFFAGLGFNARDALELAFTVGLVFMCLVVAAVYRIGIEGMRRIGDTPRAAKDLGRAFVHTLVPISLAYVVAHYFSLLAYQGQDVYRLISDPLGDGSDLFGTAGRAIDYSVVDANGIWYVQVGALILGHVAGLVLAHDRAIALYARVRDATRSQYWMLAVMVAFTCLGLWLLSAAAQS
ncbi:MAG TPA: fenitrothion hydrolase [Baekduia sp.]|nr:fenitrothion hydrolase [Baekduia sp.]